MGPCKSKTKKNDNEPKVVIEEEDNVVEHKHVPLGL